MTNPRLDQWLDALDRSRSAPASEPPGAFIHAVARRRYRRRIAAAAQGVVALAAVAFIFTMLRPTPPGPTHDHHIVAGSPSLPVSISDASMIRLTRANQARDPDDLLLPESHAASASTPAPKPRIPISARFTIDQLEQVFGDD